MGLLRARTWIAWLIALALCAPAFAIDRDRRLDQLHHTSWTSKEGAPGGVTALAQTTDGYLWIGTARGLFRFDGVRFALFEPVSGPPLAGNHIDALLAVPDGGLWIGLEAGGASLLSNGRLTNYGEREGFTTARVWCFARDRQGRIWAAVNGVGLFRLDGSRWRKFKLNGSGPVGLYVDHRGTLWAVEPAAISYLPEGELEFHRLRSRGKIFHTVAETPAGIAWMSDWGNGITPVPEPDKDEDPATRKPAILANATQILFDRQGSLWIPAKGKGLWRVPYPEHLKDVRVGAGDHEVETLAKKDGLSGDATNCILEDREGDIWVGGNSGLDRIRQAPLVPVAVSSGSYGFSLSANKDNSVQLASGNRVLMEIKDGRTNEIPGNLVALEATRLPRGYALIRHYVDDPTGKLRQLAKAKTVVGTINKPVMYEANSLRNYPELYLGGKGSLKEAADGAASKLPAVVYDHLGRAWFSIRYNSVFRLEETGFTTLESLGGPKDSADAAFRDGSDRIWFGYRNNTVALLEGDKVRTFSGKDGISVGNVNAIHEHDSRIWIGGDNGLNLFDGTRFVAMQPSVDRAFRGSRAILGPDHQGLWVGADSGVIRIADSEIEAFRKNPQHKVQVQIFTSQDGLSSDIQEPGDRTAAQGTDGRLYFATTEGVIWVDPKNIPMNRLPPPVSIESVTASGVPHLLPAPVHLPPRTTSLQIRYTALSLAVPEKVLFRYKLDGSDGTWQDAQTRRDAFYTNLGPGSYTFHVIACTGDGVWNETGATAQFVIEAAFYQTWWFRLFYIAVAAGALWLLYLYRLERATEQVQERMGARLEERERIARELHDTLLQGFQGLMLRFQAVMKTLPNEGPARPMMETVMERADQILLDGRQSVRDLREQGTSGDDLSQALNQCGTELAGDHESRYTMTLVGTPRALDAIVFTETYRIAREAMINAFHHAHAGKIEVELTYRDAGLCLRVRDDGAGIDPQVLSKGRDGHWGLSGMRERAKKIGAQFRIWSSPGAGTEIELTVPSHVAFPGHRKKSRWRRIISGGGVR